METIIWVHGDSLSPHNPALLAEPNAPAIFVWDEELINQYQLSLKRIIFIYECLLELPVVIRRGDVPREVVQFARENQATRILTTHSPSPRFRQICQAILRNMPSGSQLEVFRERPFIEIEGQIDLKRFSRYWQKAKHYALNPNKML